MHNGIAKSTAAMSGLLLQKQQNSPRDVSAFPEKKRDNLKIIRRNQQGGVSTKNRYAHRARKRVEIQKAGHNLLVQEDRANPAVWAHFLAKVTSEDDPMVDLIYYYLKAKPDLCKWGTSESTSIARRQESFIPSTLKNNKKKRKVTFCDDDKTAKRRAAPQTKPREQSRGFVLSIDDIMRNIELSKKELE